MREMRARRLVRAADAGEVAEAKQGQHEDAVVHISELVTFLD